MIEVMLGDNYTSVTLNTTYKKFMDAWKKCMDWDYGDTETYYKLFSCEYQEIDWNGDEKVIKKGKLCLDLSKVISVKEVEKPKHKLF